MLRGDAASQLSFFEIDWQPASTTKLAFRELNSSLIHFKEGSVVIFKSLLPCNALISLPSHKVKIVLRIKVLGAKTDVLQDISICWVEFKDWLVDITFLPPAGVEKYKSTVVFVVF